MIREKQSNKTKDTATINRRKRRKATQQLFDDKISGQIFHNVKNKHTFDPPKN